MSPLFHLLIALSLKNFLSLDYWFVFAGVFLDFDGILELIFFGKISPRHRIIFHSLIGWLVFTLIFSAFGAPFFSILFGAGVHIFADLFCAAGIPLFWPVSYKAYRMANWSQIVPFPKSVYSDGDILLTTFAVSLYVISVLLP